MAIKFSKEQQLAIDSSGQNIIVSAGAGSGKTAVLTERIKRILYSGIKANQLLVLTFTNAAAAEMKERITKKMASDEKLSSRTAEVDSAYITTFDSFSLSIVKKYHDRLNLSKNISIVDNSVLNVYKRKIIDEIFESYYGKNDFKFEKLLNDLTVKDDKMLKGEILNLAIKIDLRTDRDEFLNNYINIYYSEGKFNQYYEELLSILKEKIQFIKNKMAVLNIELDASRYEKLHSIILPLIESDNYDSIRANVNVKLPTFKNLEETASMLKNDIYQTVKEIKELCIYTNLSYMKEAYFQSQDYVETIISILKEFYQKTESYKKKYEAFEFIDIAKMAISLVKNNLDIREEMKNMFYEILVDEYQDTSDIQEEFISYISNNNVYMVGDIKQSIYGFRNANPLIFKNKYDNYKTNHGGMKIDLNQNFRSNRPVLDSINNIFNVIMDDNVGQANFKAEHQMKYGFTTYEKGSLNNKIRYIYYPKVDEYKNKDIDIFFVLKDIQEKIKNEEIVYDKEANIFRKCEYKDFAILLADSALFDSLSQLLSYNHIPNMIFKNVEVTQGIIVPLLKNIIKLITLDYQKQYNEDFYHCFYSVGKSFVMQMSDEELFLYITNKNFYESKLYKTIHQITLDIKNKTLLQIFNDVLNDFDIYNKLILIGDIENNITRIEYTLNMISSMDKLELDIFDFVNYIDDIMENDEKMEFQVSGMGDNKVKIMTIHKSKGLEYPIVYFINNDKLFNKSEMKDKFIYDNKYGIIAPYYIQGEGKNINYILMKENNNLSVISEKIRLLYVALTRAREQIVILNSYKIDDELDFSLSEDEVPLLKKKKYNSFSSIYNSIFNVMKQYMVDVSPYDLNINDDYLKALKIDYKDLLKPNDIVITHHKLDIKVEKQENLKASKNKNGLILKEENSLMELGIQVHRLLETIDFKNPNFQNCSIKEKEIIKKFLSSSLLKNINMAKIYKEYEFIDTIGEKQIHGIIDLMLEYDEYIDIIDYKLSNVDDEAYIKQLNVYKEYVERKSNKQVNIYLYSIIKGEIKSIGEIYEKN